MSRPGVGLNEKVRSAHGPLSISSHGHRDLEVLGEAAEKLQ